MTNPDVRATVAAHTAAQLDDLAGHAITHVVVDTDARGIVLHTDDGRAFAVYTGATDGVVECLAMRERRTASGVLVGSSAWV